MPSQLDELSREEQIFHFLSLIHPAGRDGAEQVFEAYDLLDESESHWLLNLYQFDDMDVEGECVLYVLFSDYINAQEEQDDSQIIISSMESMAAARGCAIDWGGDTDDRAFILSLGIDGLLAAAGRSLAAQGYSLWRNLSADSVQHPDGFEEYSGWISQSADDEALQALCQLLQIPLTRLS